MSEKKNTAMRRRLVSAWISTVISISLVLLLVGVGSLLLVNARAVSNYFKENMQVSVLLRQSVEEAEALAFEQQLASIPGVRSTHFVSREQGVEEMSRLLGQDFLDVFETAPVPISIDVNLTADYVSADSLEVVKEAILASPIVDEVVSETSLIDTLNRNLDKVSLSLAVVIGLLLFISVVLIASMVRLTVFSKRFSVHTMQLVGATRRFIRAPFVARSALQGLFASLLAILFLVGLLYLLRSEFAQMFQVFTLPSLLKVMGIMVASGIVICTVSTYFVVNRLVGFDRDRLYMSY